jgi:hypothetical protein
MAQQRGQMGLGPHPEDERALGRINFSVSAWDQLNWYVQFAAKPIQRLSPGERLSLREEARAIERTLMRQTHGAESVPDIEEKELCLLHAFFQKKLTELTTEGQTSLGPFELHINIVFGLVSEHIGGRGLLGSRLLTYHLAKLLMQQPRALRICPFCQKTFLLFRKNARYCSRDCQSVATMRHRRRVQQIERHGARKAQKEKTIIGKARR